MRKKWQLRTHLRVLRRKPRCFVLFVLWCLHDKTPNRWKNQVRCNFFPLWKKYVVNVYKICIHLVIFLYWSTTTSLGPRFLNMKYCTFATCVCYWPIARTMLWTRFQTVFTLFPDRQWKSTAISSRNTVDCVVKIEKGVLSGSQWKLKVHVNIANDTSNVPEKLCLQSKVISVK